MCTKSSRGRCTEIHDRKDPFPAGSSVGQDHIERLARGDSINAEVAIGRNNATSGPASMSVSVFALILDVFWICGEVFRTLYRAAQVLGTFQLRPRLRLLSSVLCQFTLDGLEQPPLEQPPSAWSPSLRQPLDLFLLSGRDTHPEPLGGLLGHDSSSHS